MRNIIGPPVVGNDFFGREKELSLAWFLLSNSNHLLLTAPRRVGKTSFVRYLEQLAKERGWKGVYVDVEDSESEIGFIHALIDKLKEQKGWVSKTTEKTIDKVGDLIKSIEIELKAGEVGSVTIKKGQSQVASNVKKKIITLLQAMETGIVIIDELPVLLNRLSKMEDGNQRVSNFLHWLRGLRQFPENKVRWVFCGSVGLDSFAERSNLTLTINDIEKFPLGAFTDDIARKFLVQLGRDNEFELPLVVRDELLVQVGWPLPYYLQLVFNKLRSWCYLQNKKLPVVEDIPKAFELAAVHSNLGTWIERLDEQLPDEESLLAKGILDYLAKRNKGYKRANIEKRLFKMGIAMEDIKDTATQLLKMLERDGYLLSTNGHYAFRSPLLRIFWNNSRNL